MERRFRVFTFLHQCGIVPVKGHERTRIETPKVAIFEVLSYGEMNVIRRAKTKHGLEHPDGGGGGNTASDVAEVTPDNRATLQNSPAARVPVDSCVTTQRPGAGELLESDELPPDALHISTVLTRVLESARGSADDSPEEVGFAGDESSTTADGGFEAQSAAPPKRLKVKPPKRPARNKAERMETALPEIMDVERAAEALGISKRLVFRYLRSGELSGRKIGREWRILKSSLMSFVGKAGQPGWLEKARADGRASIEKKKG